MRQTDRHTRRLLGCGYELPLEGARPWSPRNLDSNWEFLKDIEMVDCPGYTIKLPEVIEITRARLHWKEGGGLRDFCDENPSELLRQGVELLESSSNECQRWAMENPVKA